MELDKLDEYNARSRPLMTQTYKAYLQNNLGSKRAVKECIHDAEKALEERVATPRPGSAVSKHSKRPESAKSRSSLKSTQWPNINVMLSCFEYISAFMPIHNIFALFLA